MTLKSFPGVLGTKIGLEQTVFSLTLVSLFRYPFWAVFERTELSLTLLPVATLGVKTFTGPRSNLQSRWNELPGVGVHCVSPRCTSCDSVLSIENKSYFRRAVERILVRFGKSRCGEVCSSC